MTERASTTVYLPRELVEKAKALGLNISKTCENCLKQAVKQMESLYGENKSIDCSDNPQNG